MSLDDIPCKCIISENCFCSKNREPCNSQKLVRPYKRCTSGECMVESKCKKFVSSPYHFEPCVFDNNLSSCREPKGIPLYEYFSLNEIDIDKFNNGVSFRINDYPSKNAIILTNIYDVYCGRSYITGIEGGWFGSMKTKFDKKYNLNVVNIDSYHHSKIISDRAGYSPERLEVIFKAEERGFFNKNVITYRYIVTFDWRKQIGYAELYKEHTKIDTSTPHSLQYI